MGGRTYRIAPGTLRDRATERDFALLAVLACAIVVASLTLPASTPCVHSGQDEEDGKAKNK